MSKNHDEKENFVLIWNRIHLQMIGAWPHPDKDVRISNLISFLVGSNVVLFISIPQTLFVFKIWPDLYLVPECLSLANFPATIAVLKLFALCRNRQALTQIIASIYRDWNRVKSDFEWKTMKANAQVSKVITLYCFFFTMSAVSLFLVQEVYLNLRAKYDTRQYLYLSHFPYCSTKQSSSYYFIILFQFTGGLWSAVTYCGLISFCGMLIMHLHGQFDILKFNIEKLINNHNFQSIDQFRSKLKFLVVQHEHLNRFGLTIEETFNKVFLLEMIMFSIELCLQGYMILHSIRTEFSIYEIVFWTSFVFTILSNLYVICYIGEKISNTNTILENSIHQSEWYNLKAPEARDLIMLLLRTKNPLQITAGKFCAFSFETFMSIIKRAFAFMSMLLTVNQNTVDAI